MVEAERKDLGAWLGSEPHMPAPVLAAGFAAEMFERGWLHAYGRFRVGSR
jgi:hypothetical protein